MASLFLLVFLDLVLGAMMKHNSIIWIRVPVSLALSSCQYVFASEAWPRAGLGEPRSASKEVRLPTNSKHGCD